MVLSRANAAGMSLKTGPVISSLPYIPGKYAIATADIFVNIPAMLSPLCVASAKNMEDSSIVPAEACWFDSRAFEERYGSAEVLVAVNDGLSVSSLSKEADTETKLSSLSSTDRLATINEFFMDTLIGTDENFNGQQTALHIKVTVPSNAVSFAFQSSKVAVAVTAVNDAPVINIISNSSLWGKCYPTVIFYCIGFGLQRRRNYRVARFSSTS
jgi:hypothetical protein